jgi:hypothetical protein
MEGIEKRDCDLQNAIQMEKSFTTSIQGLFLE